MYELIPIFKALLGIYCVVALFMLARPLVAISFFLSFRTASSIAAYMQVPSIAGLPFFIPALIVLAIQALTSLFQKNVVLKINYVLGTYLAFLSVVFMTGIIHVVFGKSFFDFLIEFSKLTFPVMAYILVYIGLKNKDDLYKYARYLALASLIPISTAFLQFALNVGLSYDDFTFVKGLRPSGTIIDPNLFGIYLSLCLFVALPSILKHKKLKKALLYTLFVVFMIVVARNRGTWIALFAAFLFAVPVFRSKLSVGKWIVVAAVIMVVALPVFMARFANLNEYDQYGQKQDTASGRFEYSSALLEHSMNKPILGHGTGGYDIGFYRAAGVPLEPHNDYLLIASQYGFPAMVLFVVFLLLQIKWTLKHKDGRLWAYQFSALLCQVYLIIISSVQNVIVDNTAYMLIFSIMAMSHRASVFNKDLDNGNDEKSFNEFKGPKWIGENVAPKKRFKSLIS